jgi:LEA14-like dessication related protein
LFIGLVSFTFILYFKSNFRSPEFISIEKVQYLETIGTDVFFNAQANFHNPNSFDAQILNSELKILSKDLQIAQISQSNICKVNSKSYFKIDFKFKIDIAELSLSHGIAGVLANLLSETKEIPVHFIGYTRVRCKGIVYKIPIDVDQKLIFK